MELGDRRVLFSHWVEEVHIVVERIPGMKRANNKTAVVWLKRLPLPLYFPVGRQLPSAAAVSSETDGSDSRPTCCSSAATADPQLPISDGDAVPGCDEEEPGSGCTPNGGSPGERAAYADSDAGAENLRANGHTSWQICRYTHTSDA